MSCPHNLQLIDESSSTRSQDKGELPIPQPPTHFFTGNLFDIDVAEFAESIYKLVKIYGPIFKLELPSRRLVVVSGYELFKDTCDDARFEKTTIGNVDEVRNILGDGLFTAKSDEKNWFVAHRTLMPSFGPLGIRKMFPQMMDIASQLILKWDRMGSEHEIVTSDDFTISSLLCFGRAFEMAFDTIGLCAFNYRFNSFYTENVHPYAAQMARTLLESGIRGSLPKLFNHMRLWSTRHYWEDIAAMHKLCDEIVADRRAHPRPDVNDLLNVMLNTADPVTGEKLSDENIRFQMATFLVAGHETTSGTLSFLFYNLLKNPETLHKAQKEVDQVVGDKTLEFTHLSQLKYVEACVRETLRARGPIGAFSKHAKKTTLLGGKYKVHPEDQILFSLMGLHHDYKIWGEDADLFKPERLLGERWDHLPQNSWKPFGDGIRACIGRGFAEQEMLAIVALILQTFQPQMADPSYDLKLKSTLTVKPDGFRLKVRRRPGKVPVAGLLGQMRSTSSKVQATLASQPKSPITSNGQSVLILYGSNAGTCKAFAEEIQSNASNYGLNPETRTLDDATEHVPCDCPIVIISPSYEGKPADNAKKFVTWLEAHSKDVSKMDGVKYTVFGVGNSEWSSTFHRIPKLIDRSMGQMGAQTFYRTGLADVNADLIGAWEEWLEGLWKALRLSNGVTGDIVTSELEVSFEKSSLTSALAEEQMNSGTVVSNKQIAGAEVGPIKRHMQIKLPPEMTYATGDYLVVLPHNGVATVNRVLSHFQLHSDDFIKISGTKKAFLRSQPQQPVFVLLATRVELGTPASQRQIAALVEYCRDEKIKKELQQLCADSAYTSRVLERRYSLLDLLEDFPNCKLPFSVYLDMLKPLASRQYSISSSLLLSSGNPNNMQNDAIASITYDIHSGPALSGNNRNFRGVASNYLAALSEGNKVHCYVRSTNRAFHLPSDPSTPIVMIAAGSGIAPMRGFIQERAAIASARGDESSSTHLGTAILYFGCRDHELDFIYADELRAWEEQGIVDVRPAFSKRAPSGEKTRYVPDRIYEDKQELKDLFSRGAKIFVCGSASKLAKSTATVCKKIWLEANSGSEDKEADEWLETVRETRYVSDVFG